MAGAHRYAVDPVNAEPRSPRAALRAEFFQSVRLILAAVQAGEGGRPVSIGGDTRPQDEPLRIGTAIGLRHPDAEMSLLSREGEMGPLTMEVGFMGLTGPSGALPDHYSDRVVAGRRARDEGLARFLDIFNHRMLSHFYRAWAKYRLPVRFGETGGDLSDPFSIALAALAGIARAGNDPRLLEIAGPLSRRIRSASALRRIISALFELPVEIVELAPRWIRIAPDEQTRLGSADAPEGRYAQLGVNAVAGASVFDLAGRFRVRVGPLDLPTFRSFFDRGGLRDRMTETIRFAVGPNIDFDLQLVLRQDAVPRMNIGGGVVPAALGHSGWLLSGPAESDRGDAVLSSRRTGDQRLSADGPMAASLDTSHARGG
jgi:type VI secretion system protein ImpH